MAKYRLLLNRDLEMGALPTFELLNQPHLKSDLPELYISLSQ